VRSWCLGKLDAAFFAKMENILGLYSCGYNPKRPVICFDEGPCFLIGQVITPLPIEVGKHKTKPQHYEYEKNGSCTVFAAFEPHTGRRWIRVFARRSGKEYAQFMRFLAKQFPHAEKIVLIQDNLSTHSPASFYAQLKPPQAFMLMQRFEWHFTPTKASWLNMIEIELSALARQCLNRRIATQAKLQAEVSTWVKQRNLGKVTIHWQFSIPKARKKFAGRYPNV
jgi:hypothetical protein